MKKEIGRLITLRKRLHRAPELSGRESKTAKLIADRAARYHPDDILSGLGGAGVAVVFAGNGPGPTLLIRAELDALPLTEEEKGTHTSKKARIAHLCGHDGHMAIVAGLFPLLAERRPARGRAVLLFQPAEETGAGAAAVLADPRFTGITPDLFFALHNIPGFPTGVVLTRRNEFASASAGMIARLTGKTAHAAEPEKGLNPARAIAELIPALIDLPEKLAGLREFALCTIVGIALGGHAFGTSAGDGELLATLRAYRNDDMDILTAQATALSKDIALKHGLRCTVGFTEQFPATVNDPAAVTLVETAAQRNGIAVEPLSEPFKWSEDIGHFTARFPGALFGIGAGERHPPLHHPSYDFPDDIIKTGITMFHTLIREVLG
jgi:amidohydrolase